MELGLALSVVSIIVGLVALAQRLRCPPTYETPVAIAVGVAISLGYTVAAQVPGGLDVANALLRGIGLGLSAAGLMATVRRLAEDTRRRRSQRPRADR